ncbi:MAG: phytanoyl-CoA dioxygenase family protein [Gammaproteobacteria bacterium]
MKNIEVNFQTRGFAVIKSVLSKPQLVSLPDKCDAELVSKAGSRNLLQKDWIKEISTQVTNHHEISPLLPENVVAVQCTYFSKTLDKNWLVPLHRDLSIPVKEKFSSDEWSGWSVKEGVNFAQPPEQILKSLIAVRIHFEDNTAENGALQIIPGSHTNKDTKEERVVCEVPKGGALVMCPLLLHSSSKLEQGARRVLHFLYGPCELPSPAEWAHAV